MAERLTKAQRERFEYGEVERQAARERLMHEPGSWCDRLLGWAERMAREGREEANERVRAEDEAGRAALNEARDADKESRNDR